MNNSALLFRLGSGIHGLIHRIEAFAQVSRVGFLLVVQRLLFTREAQMKKGCSTALYVLSAEQLTEAREYCDRLLSPTKDEACGGLKKSLLKPYEWCVTPYNISLLAILGLPTAANRASEMIPCICLYFLPSNSKRCVVRMIKTLLIAVFIILLFQYSKANTYTLIGTRTCYFLRFADFGFLVRFAILIY
ncbi:hypothetical protein T265_05421 [Opisthorchis viverrini]|uniref:Uncharacterized protein n=1 Tax=Opisthorchis viverrini TaxID=6198 RepID=A0A074ZVY5_OPIVI|nr:hypothetical protein T265_05421 [Opisthorchis viverrini]KER27530.1 hypothetical protein T265_05421 [Opisthorchis viverrini]